MINVIWIATMTTVDPVRAIICAGAAVIIGVIAFAERNWFRK